MLIALANLVPAILSGDDHPKDDAERLALARMCDDAKRHAVATRLWADTLADDPTLGDDLRNQHRYNAACSAALGAAGQGKDDPPPDDAAKTKLRGQALGWLKAELDAWAKRLDRGETKARPSIARTLRH